MLPRGLRRGSQRRCRAPRSERARSRTGRRGSISLPWRSPPSPESSGRSSARS
jgi:hypothetical protein